MKEGRQREAEAIIYLCQLLFNIVPVLQRYQLLFGALCCQHLASRAEHIAEKHTGY